MDSCRIRADQKEFQRESSTNPAGLTDPQSGMNIHRGDLHCFATTGTIPETVNVEHRGGSAAVRAKRMQSGCSIAEGEAGSRGRWGCALGNWTMDRRAWSDAGSVLGRMVQICPALGQVRENW